MIKSLTDPEKKKDPNYLKQKNFLFLFLFCFLCCCCCWKTGVYTRIFDRKTFKKARSIILNKILVINLIM